MSKLPCSPSARPPPRLQLGAPSPDSSSPLPPGWGSSGEERRTFHAMAGDASVDPRNWWGRRLHFSGLSGELLSNLNFHWSTLMVLCSQFWSVRSDYFQKWHLSGPQQPQQLHKPLVLLQIAIWKKEFLISSLAELSRSNIKKVWSCERQYLVGFHPPGYLMLLKGTGLASVNSSLS